MIGFNAPFWGYTFPDSPSLRKWWHEAWVLSLDNPTDRTFVAEDIEKDNKIVAFGRWMLPQQDGNLERKFPDLDENEFDMEVVGAFFGGMEENRHELMGERPHWSTISPSM